MEFIESKIAKISPSSRRGFTHISHISREAAAHHSYIVSYSTIIPNKKVQGNVVQAIKSQLGHNTCQMPRFS